MGAKQIQHIAALERHLLLLAARLEVENSPIDRVAYEDQILALEAMVNGERRRLANEVQAEGASSCNGRCELCGHRLWQEVCRRS